jgi:predicted alpha/beta superfamily hydrolase
MHTLNFNNYLIHIYPSAIPENTPILYTHFAKDELEKVTELCHNAPFTLINIDGINWNRDMSPWQAEKVFKSGTDFAGGADAYMKVLTVELIPEIEKALGFIPVKRGIVGYSMAGLFSIYALYKTNLFQLGASISGSLWFDGFLKYMQTHDLQGPVERIYFSLGDKEKKTKNPRMAQVEESTTKAEQYLRGCGIDTIYEVNQGNHFADVPERIAKGLMWLVKA